MFVNVGTVLAARTHLTEAATQVYRTAEFCNLSVVMTVKTV
jgi:hypothetical protein